MSLNNIGIIGLGLIGGSIGLDLQAAGYRVCGLVHKEETVKRAKERKLAQSISTDPTVIEDCSLVILALPLTQLIEPTTSLLKALPDNAVITDVGSVKAPVIKAWEKLHPRFVGSHPMAGTIETGVEAGRRKLFINRPWIATPNQRTSQEDLEIVHELAITLGSRWVTTDATSHDQTVALISHLPVFISAALLQSVKDHPNKKLVELSKVIASTGFADTTRVGSGNPDLGLAMAMSNTNSLLNALDSYRSYLGKLEKIIQKKEWAKLKTQLKETQKSRPDFL